MRSLILPLFAACTSPAEVPSASDASSQVPAQADEDTDYPEPPELVPVRALVCEALSDDPCLRWMTLYVPFYPWWYRSIGELPPPYSEVERWVVDTDKEVYLFRRGHLYVYFPTISGIDVSDDPNVLPEWDDAYLPCTSLSYCASPGDGTEVHPDYPAPD